MMTRERAEHIWRSRNKARSTEAEAVLSRMTPSEEAYVSEVWSVLRRTWKRAIWLDAFKMIMWGKVEKGRDGITIVPRNHSKRKRQAGDGDYAAPKADEARKTRRKEGERD